MNRASARALLGRAAARALWQPDMWDRLVLAANCVGTASTVMDVGGRGHQLAWFLPSAKVGTANIAPPADFIVDARVLPFTDGQFDVVTSCDTLEHMPAVRRPEHIAELVRVASRRLVICCPYGSPQKQEAELQVADVVRRVVGSTLPYLQEHLEFGFPREEDVIAMVRAAAPGAQVRCLYYGDYPSGNALLLDGVRARWGHDPKALLRFVWNAYLRPRRPRLEPTATATTARLYLIADFAP
ncbi:MAG TPA: methyltransferase domain-containing protein [Streptosporangiaceae bacterium]|nr:methyltransferase domain-containing protein [Streptosporangiaceae bacterium]